MNNKTAFIGHRNIYDADIREKLYKEVKSQIIQGCKYFILGTHGEFDKMALSVCRELKKIYNDIVIEVVITSLKTLKPIINKDAIYGYEKYFLYDDVKTVMYDIEETYYKKQITLSNRKMIDSCCTLICYVNKKRNPSGAKLAMNYAKKKGLKIINLYKDE